MNENKAKPQKKRKCFIINLADEEPMSSIVSTEVPSHLVSELMSPQDKVKELQKKLTRYRKRSRNNFSTSHLHPTVEQLHPTVQQLESKIQQLEEEHKKIHLTFTEQLRSKDKEIHELLNSGSQGLLALNLENMQEKLFAKTQAVSEMNVKVSRLEADKQQLDDELRRTKVELLSLRSSNNTNE